MTPKVVSDTQPAADPGMLPPMQPAPSIRLGPFELDAPAGRGAMAEVWRAHHVSQGATAAVKVVTAPVGRQQTFRTWFAHELRAVACLDHPGVVRIFDHGRIDPATAAASAGRLPADAPFMVMEWLDGGPLTRRAARLPWHALRPILLGLLDALGHAHARGVIHRDLKPDNILLTERGAVLTDFGVAFTAERAADAREEAFAGTPNYMSPEQVTGDLKALGPWSDLYALGCLAHTLITGAPPFDGKDASQVARSQLLAPPPALAADLPVPRGFQRWLHRLLAKRPAERFRFAADAAVALMALPDEAPVPPTPPRTGSLPYIDPSEADRTIVAPPVFLSTSAESWAAGPDLLGRPPVPLAWRRPTPPARPPPLLGVGRSLFGLRPTSLHGRETEQDVAWQALRQSARGDGARAVVIDGPSGLGKSRLARWLAHRAHELGVADVFVAQHDATAGPDGGLGPMLSHAWRCDGLDARKRRRQVQWVFGSRVEPGLVDAIAALVAPGDAWEDGDIRIASAAERNSVLADGLAVLARRRPLILLLEDVHWSTDTLGFVDHVLTARRELPILFVCTVREAGLTEDGTVRELLDRITGQPGVQRLVLQPLSDAAMVAQIGERLPLDDALLATVVERAGGNPRFAEALLERWLAQGAFEDGPTGFRLRPGADDALPDGVRSIWRERLADIVGPEPTPALELAAMLGQTVDTHEWHAVCAEAGVIPTDAAVIDSLLDAGLLAGHGAHRWSFGHPTLRETLLEDARRAGRFVDGHRTCAAMLARRQCPPARRARHLMHARAWSESLAPLLDAADTALSRKQVAGAHRALVARCRALRKLRWPRRHREWLVTRVRWARLCWVRGATADAARHARHATVDAERLGDDRILSTALLERGRAMSTTKGIAHGLPLVIAAAHRATAAGEPTLEANARLLEGGMRLASGDPVGAEAAYRIALEHQGADDELMRANVLAALADLARRSGDREMARQHATGARAAYARAGSRWGQAHAANLLGDIARYGGDLDGAETHYRESSRLYGGLGSVDALAADGNLALVLFETARSAEARQRFEQVIRRCDASHRLELGLIFRACLLPCLATDGDWTAWDEVFGRLAPLYQSDLLEPDVPRMAERAARIATSAGKARRAARAWKLVIAQLDGLGRDARHARDALERLRRTHGRPPS